MVTPEMLLSSIQLFLAHLSQRLIGELIGYSWSKSSVRPQFQTSSLKPLDQSKPNSMWSLLGKGERVYINGPGHMTKMAAIPIYGKNLKNLIFQNQMSYDLETWHVALVTQALQSLYK